MYYPYVKIYPNVIAIFKCSLFPVLFILKSYILARNIFIGEIFSLLSFNTHYFLTNGRVILHCRQLEALGASPNLLQIHA